MARAKIATGNSAATVPTKFSTLLLYPPPSKQLKPLQIQVYFAIPVTSSGAKKSSASWYCYRDFRRQGCLTGSGITEDILAMTVSGTFSSTRERTDSLQQLQRTHSSSATVHLLRRKQPRTEVAVSAVGEYHNHLLSFPEPLRHYLRSPHGRSG